MLFARGVGVTLEMLGLPGVLGVRVPMEPPGAPATKDEIAVAGRRIIAFLAAHIPRDRRAGERSAGVIIGRHAQRRSAADKVRFAGLRHIHFKFGAAKFLNLEAMMRAARVAYTLGLKRDARVPEVDVVAQHDVEVEAPARVDLGVALGQLIAARSADLV